MEHTVALLRSPLDDDKNPLITEIIGAVAKGDRQVLYVNTEHRAETFIERFSDNENLMIFNPSYDDPDDPRDYADLVFAGLEEAISEMGIRTFIIDSVSRIAALSFGRNASPAYIMKRLVALQARHNLSLLVIAHTSTKSTDRVLTTLSDVEIPGPESSTNDCRDATRCVCPQNTSEFSNPSRRIASFKPDPSKKIPDDRRVIINNC